MTYDQTGMKTYEGEWINNKKNGRGKLFYEDGDYYDGNFVNDKRHGIGMVLSKTSGKIEMPKILNFIIITSLNHRYYIKKQ